MGGLAEFFSMVRVINLPERRDRLRDVRPVLSRLGLELDGEQVAVYPADRPSEAAGFPSVGARGCFLSHLAVLREARQRCAESVLVLEDDLDSTTAQAEAAVRLARELAGRDWAFAFFGHFLPSPATPPGGEDTEMWSTLVGPLQTAHFYAVHGDTLPSLIAYLEQCLERPPGDPVGGPMEYDGALTMFRQWNPDAVTLIAQPSVGGQRSSASSIHARKMDTLPGARHLAAGLRRIRRTVAARRS